MNTLTKLDQTELDQTAIALSFEKNSAQLMLDFDDFYYVIYNNTQTESLRKAIAIDHLIEKYLAY